MKKQTVNSTSCMNTDVCSLLDPISKPLSTSSMNTDVGSHLDPISKSQPTASLKGSVDRDSKQVLSSKHLSTPFSPVLDSKLAVIFSTVLQNALDALQDTSSIIAKLSHGSSVSEADSKGTQYSNLYQMRI